MRKRYIVISALCISVAIMVSVSLATSEVEKKNKSELFRQVELFSDTLAIIHSDYVEDVNFKNLIYGALKGMLSSLDAHSQFMDPETYNDLKVDTEGKFGGIGIELTVKDGLLTVITPIEDTPAWKANVKANDRIVKINNELTRDMTIGDAVKKLRGKPGESVSITVFRESEKKILEIKLVRQIIKIQDVKHAKILEDGIGYIRLVEFSETAPRDFNAAIDKLTKEGMNALIIDLRNNPGGLLTAAIEISEKFLDKDKVVVSIKGKKNSQNMVFTSRSVHPVKDLPIAVLINEGSASGSEIVAAALQDNKRGIILGTKSFGKASVQTVIPLSDGSALRLTTAKYFTPLGKLIHEKGIVPDIIVEEGKIELAEQEKERETKADSVFKNLDKKEEALPAEIVWNYKADNQLMRAVDILKALKLYQK